MLSRRGFLWVGLLCLSVVSTATGMTHRHSTVDDLTSSASRIFRGICERVDTSSVAVAGARLPMTTYTFRVSERLKGSGGARLTFHQIGTPSGGPSDLGTLAGLPVYSVGHEYLLFLLPECRAGLTSPAGAAQGAFEILGERARALRDVPGDPPLDSYKNLREKILRRVRR